MVAPVVLAAGISAASSLLGGLFGGKKKGPSLEEQAQHQIHAQKEMDLKRPSWVVEGAKAAGLHPLAVLGMPAVGASVGSIGGGSESSGSRMGRTIADMGQGVSRAVSAYKDAETRATEKRMIDLQMQGLELDNVRKASEIKLMNQPGNPPGMSVTGAEGFHDMLSKQMPGQMGIQKGAPPIFKTAVDQKGNPIRVWNEEDLGDSEVLAALTSMGYSVPDWIHGNIGKPAASKLRKLITHVRGSYTGRR